MKSNLQLFLALASLLLVVSCTYTFQVATIKGNYKQDDSKSYVIENDTVRIKYSFKGDNCPIIIEVYNKLNIPVYIDWSKSAFIQENKRFPYWIDESQISANADRITYSNSIINGSIYKNDRVSFLPPVTLICITPLTAINDKINISAPYYQTVKVYGDDNIMSNYKGFLHTFQENDSPFKFRSFLTLSTVESFVSPFYFDSHFWVGTVFQAVSNETKAFLKSPLSQNQFLRRIPNY